MSERKKSTPRRVRVSSELVPYLNLVSRGLELIKLHLKVPERKTSGTDKKMVTVRLSPEAEMAFSECVEMFDVSAPQLIEGALIQVQKSVQRDLS